VIRRFTRSFVFDIFPCRLLVARHGFALPH
jgi:hypothetical protein